MIKNLYKLITKEDFFHIHKLLGLTVLIHFIYRFYLLKYYKTTLLENDSYTPYLLCIHTLLSSTSLIFKIPSNRIVGKPMIYPEFRLHSIIFAYRSIICTFLFYYNFPIYYNYVTCILTMLVADRITKYYKSTTKTMRNMPYNNISDNNIKSINRIYSKMQILATLFMLGNINTSFTPLLAIQLAAFLMTLVRKSIIGANTWHQFYMLSLLININAWVTMDLSKKLLFFIFSELFVLLRFEYNVNKYGLWISIMLIFNILIEYSKYIDNISINVNYVNYIATIYFLGTNIYISKSIFINK